MYDVFQRLGKVISSHIRGLTHKTSKQEEIFVEHYDHQTRNADLNHNHVVDEKERQYRADLEVDANTNIEGIRIAYKTLMKKYHPDLHVADQKKRKTAEQITKKLNEAMSYFEKKYGKS